MTESLSTPVPYDLDGFADYVRTTQLPVVIFGASLTGEVAVEQLQSKGIAVDRFCDNDKMKVGHPFCGIEVVSAKKLADYYQDAIVLITTKYILDAIEQLRDAGFKKWAPQSEMLRGSEANIGHGITRFEREYVEFAMESCVVSQSKYLDPEKLFLLSVDLMVTERCSLKCVSCSNLMQYYDRPVDVSVDESLIEIDDLCTVVDEINEVRVIGGDPFMNKNYHQVVAGLVNNPKVNKIVLYSNGVIIPKDDQIPALKNSKVFVIITDYDDLSRNRDTIVKIFDEHKIAYHVQVASGWNDCSDISPNRRSDDELTHMFKNCCVKNYATVLGGNLFRCPFAANADRLHAIPDFPDDHVNLRGASAGGRDVAELKKQLRYYLTEKPYLKTCDFCNGRVFGGDGVIPGVQTKKPLEYVKYERSCN